MEEARNIIVSGDYENKKIKKDAGEWVISYGFNKIELFCKENVRHFTVLEHEEKPYYKVDLHQGSGAIWGEIEPNKKTYNLVEVCFNSGKKCVMELTDDMLDLIR